MAGRVHQHKAGTVEGFTKEYSVTRLVYYETYDSIDEAIRRERQIKKWNRQWKIELIEKGNPDWVDLYPGLAAL